MREGILFTNKKLDGQILFMMRYNFENNTNGEFDLGVYDITDCACIGEVLDDEGYPIDISNLTLRSRSFSAFDDKIAMIDKKYLTTSNCLADAYCFYDAIEKNSIHLDRLMVNKNCRDLGLAKSMIEVIKTFGYKNKFKEIYGTAAPLDVLKNKKEIYKPVKNVQSSIFHPNCLFSELVEPEDDELVDETPKESYSCLKYIYERLGFEVESSSSNRFGSISFDVTKYRPTINYENIVNLISLEPCNEFTRIDFDLMSVDSSKSDGFERL